MSYNKAEKNKSKGRKEPKKITPTYLHNSGLYYLERFSASKSHFKDVMIRKVKRSCLQHKEQDFEACAKMVTELADKFESCGLLNDESYAQALASSSRRKGLSQKAAYTKMLVKGLSAPCAKNALNALDTLNFSTREDAEFFAALTFSRKKKLGVFFMPRRLDEEENIQKSLGTFARAGFSYDIAHKILDMSLEEIEDSFHVLKTLR